MSFLFNYFRYDVRGALYDLREAESKGEEPRQYTDMEIKLEELCDHERYFAMYHDETQVGYYEGMLLSRGQSGILEGFFNELPNFHFRNGGISRN